jgi:hypothetical protein
MSNAVAGDVQAGSRGTKTAGAGDCKKKPDIVPIGTRDIEIAVLNILSTVWFYGRHPKAPSNHNIGKTAFEMRGNSE